jgi:DNA polymerase IV
VTSGRWILHVDLDQFLAAVEVLRHPELRGRPVVVGGAGDPTQRRVVVSTASYEARAYGVHSGMPLRAAARRCPDAVFLPLDPPTYDAASARVMAVLRRMPVVVEVFGWDEAFLASDAADPERLAAGVQAAVLADTGLHCSVGIGRNKLQAKLATGFAKPAGVYRLTDETWMAVMGERSTSAIWGIGDRTAERLAALGIRTVAQLAIADLRQLAAAFGPTIGPSLRAMGMGLGPTDVTAVPRVPRSRSRETTFASDLTERSDIEARVVELARELVTDAAAAGRRVIRVAVKVRVVPYLTRVSARTLSGPTLDADAIVEGVLAVLERFDLACPVRLLGVRVDYEQPEPEGGGGPTPGQSSTHRQPSPTRPGGSR